jgi:hypothetical protein
MNELFPMTEQELVVWKLEYSAAIEVWRDMVQVTPEPAPIARVTKWLIELERACPGTVVYTACRENDIYLENGTSDVAVYVVGVRVWLMTVRYYKQVIEYAQGLRLQE